MNALPELPAHQLTHSHLQQAPVWRFLNAGESDDPQADESQVRGQQPPPRLGEYASYLVSAQYTLKNGMQLPGLVQVGLLGNQVECMPIQLFARDQSVDPLGKEAAARLARMHKADHTQPVRWQLEVRIEGETDYRRGKIKPPGLLQALDLLMQLGRLRRPR